VFGWREQLGGEVVACDSTQLYRGFDIGTAKPKVASGGKFLIT